MVAFCDETHVLRTQEQQMWLSIAWGDGQISLRGSHVFGSVLVDVAVDERDFCAAIDVGASTLAAERAWITYICPWGQRTDLGGSHDVSSVLVDVAIREGDGGTTSDVGTATLESRERWTDWEGRGASCGKRAVSPGGHRRRSDQALLHHPQ